MGQKKYLILVERHQPTKMKDEGEERKLKWYDVRNECCCGDIGGTIRILRGRRFGSCAIVGDG